MQRVRGPRKNDRVVVSTPCQGLHGRKRNRSVRVREQVRVWRQALPQMVFPRMIAPHITMEVKIGGFEETSEQGNCRSKCAEPAHREPFYKSLPGKANHLPAGEVELTIHS